MEACGARKKNLTLVPSQSEREDGEIDDLNAANPEGVQLCITMGAAHGSLLDYETMSLRNRNGKCIVKVEKRYNDDGLRDRNGNTFLQP